MDLLTELHGHVRAYLDGRYSLDDLHYEITGYVQDAADAADAGDGRAERLLGRILGLVSEYSDGFRSEDSVRHELATPSEVPAHAERHPASLAD